jgi:hypothetical protein
MGFFSSVTGFSNGEHLKYGISNNPATRYSPGQLAGGRLKILAQGSGAEMLQLERSLHETMPIGSEEGQSFYMQKQVNSGLKPPPYKEVIMKYQLVLQFRAASTEDFDDLVALEELLIEKLPLESEVDGHDFGVDEFNIFVLTDHPKETFHASETLIQQRHPRQQLKAAYRELDKNEFVILWPPNLREFRVV